MKKLVSVIMSLALIACIFAGCTKQENLKSDIVLITDGKTITDGGYNESALDGISAYAQENNMKCRYYQPSLDDKDQISVESVEKYVDISSKNGAKFIVLPGEDFAVSAYEIAPSYPDVNFILIDAIPHSADDTTDRFVSNVMSVSFNAVQGGFLAGYLAVANGNTNLGYFGQANSKNSANYGAGFVQGAAYAADTLSKPVKLEWADYDSALLDYDYNFNVTACYKKISDVKDDTFKVTVENGIGSGVYTEGTNVTITADPAPAGKVFDKWEIKSDTKGVKDKKVNVSSKTKSSMNLIVEKCDCTLTATYKDAEGTNYTLTVLDTDGKNTYSTATVADGSEYEITAPVAENNMVFDHWESSNDKQIEDVNSKTTKVKDIKSDITVTPVYVKSDEPTFNVNVVTGEGGDGASTGSGSYISGDKVTVTAAAPKDGYMFSHWENIDSSKNSTGIAMENEYCYSTTFDMVDRYASICDTMYENGTTLIFAGGNSKVDSVATSKSNFDYDLYFATAGEKNNDALITIVNNYGEAAKDCLANFKGGTVVSADCSTDAIYSTYVSAKENDEISKNYDAVYKALAENKIPLTQAEGGAGYKFCTNFNKSKASKCLTLNGWFLPYVELNTES